MVEDHSVHKYPRQTEEKEEEEIVYFSCSLCCMNRPFIFYSREIASILLQPLSYNLVQTY